MANGATPDPFDQLVDACRETLAFVERREKLTNEESARRKSQRAKVNRAIAVLTGLGSGGTVTSQDINRFICKKCGNHHQSKAHKEACFGICSRCKGQMVYDGDSLDPGRFCTSCGHRPRPVPEGLEVLHDDGRKVRESSHNGVPV